MDTNANANTAKLTMDSLREVMEKCKALEPEFAAIVVTAEVRQALVRDVPTLGIGRGDLYGIDVYEKPGQILPAWKFKDRKMALDYVKGLISEFDLLLMEDRTGRRDFIGLPEDVNN